MVSIVYANANRDANDTWYRKCQTMHSHALRPSPNQDVAPAKFPNNHCPLLCFPRKSPKSPQIHAMQFIIRQYKYRVRCTKLSKRRNRRSLVWSRLAFIVCHMSVACRCSCELSPTTGTVGLGCCPRFFTLVSEQVAKSGELSSIAAMVPTLRLPWVLNNADSIIGIRRD